MTTRHALCKALSTYQTSFADEKPFILEFLSLLDHPRAFFRDHLPGHITGSAWIIDETKQFALLTHHAKLNRWLQPGGHADGDENVFHVALREAAEETGLKHLQSAYGGLFDIDIHRIPARQDFPSHLHYDVRVVLQASRHEPLTVTDESHNLSWIPFTQLASLTGNNGSILRMAAKTAQLP